MGRISVFAYGIISYFIFFGTFLYAIGWVGNIAVPRSVDSGIESSAVTAVVVNLALLSLFAIQHSGMARPAFKRWLARTVPPAAERSTYVLLSSFAMIVLFWQWRPVAGVVWEIEAGALHTAALGLYFAGWAIVLYATFLIDHFELFGLRQVWRNLRGESLEPARFKTPGFYKWVRHPIYVGWFIVFWATPAMTVGHLFLSLVVSAYIVVAVQLEERDLVEELGDDYRSYRESTPAFVPGTRGAAPRRKAKAVS